MIDDYKEIFRKGASQIKDWENLSKNELCFGYLENEDNPELKSAYFSALMYKYWPLINKYYFMSNNVASQEDCYDWLVDSIQYALKHHRWDDPSSTIYKDPNGPDKVINRRMKCARLTFYQFINRKKRKDNFGVLSLDDLLNLSETNHNLTEAAKDQDPSSLLDLQKLVHKVFLRKDYFLAFMIDIIINDDVFDFNDGVFNFNIKKLAKRLRYITPEYCTRFAEEYEIDQDVYYCYITYCRNLSSSLIYNKIEHNLLKLRHEKYFKT